MKELTWENGYITEFTENIDIVGSQPMTITFVFFVFKLQKPYTY